MSGVIMMKDMIEEMNSGELFSLEFTTANKKTGKGGVLKAYPQVRKYRVTPSRKSGASKKMKPAGNEIIKIYVVTEPEKDKRIKDVHLMLITKFNGKTVL